jgi:putative phosphoesterase
MRVAVISDMHGNAVAFDAVLADIAEQGIDQVVCLGDALQGGPQPVEVAARLRELGCPVVIGNADAEVLTGGVGAEDLAEWQSAVLHWSAAQLGDGGLALIQQFQQTVTLDLDGGRQLLCFHGSPASFHEIILPNTSEDDVQQMLSPYLPALMTGGHTHLQQIRRVSDSVFFNPGSVGLPFNRYQQHTPPLADPWAEYAILTSESSGAYSIELRHLPYDVAAFVDVIRASGMPHADILERRYSR